MMNPQLPPDPAAEFQKFLQNPVQNLINVGLDVPAGMTDPNQILNHLLSTNKITQEMCNQAMIQS